MPTGIARYRVPKKYGDMALYEDNGEYQQGATPEGSNLPEMPEEAFNAIVDTIARRQQTLADQKAPGYVSANIASDAPTPNEFDDSARLTAANPHRFSQSVAAQRTASIQKPQPGVEVAMPEIQRRVPSRPLVPPGAGVGEDFVSGALAEARGASGQGNAAMGEAGPRGLPPLAQLVSGAAIPSRGGTNPAPDGDPDYTKAKVLSGLMGGAAGISGAIDRIGNALRHTPESDAAMARRQAERVAGAQAPLESLQMDRGEATMQAQLASAKAKADPSSLVSKHAQQMAAGGDPKLAAALSGMSAAEIEKYAPALVKRAEAEADRAFQLQKMKDTQAFEGRQNALDRSSRERSAHEGVQANRLEGDVQKLGKDTESLGTIANDVALLEGYANKPAGTDIPGAGMVDSLRPDWAQTDDGLKVQQAALRVAAELLHQQSGAAVSPSEAARFMGGRGLGAGATESAWRQGVQALASELRQSLAAKQAKYRPEVVQTLQQRGGLPSLGASAPAETPRKVVGGKTYEKRADGWYEVI